LTHANAFRGVTKVVEGTLVIENQTGSGTGTREVVVAGGTLAGNGIMAEEVTVTPGSVLAPSAAAKETRTLTLQKTLTFKPTSTYTYKLNATRASADQVIAHGVTIEDRVRFDFKAVADQKLATGTVFTMISNTSANPINGTFLHLPDNSIISAGSNAYQVSYEGGDGNDLTLTVVP
jgi:hypothetical protein